jgi:hypothetical protein
MAEMRACGVRNPPPPRHQSVGMMAFAEGRPEESVDNFFRNFSARDSAADGDDVCVVVLASHACCVVVMAEGTANAIVLVCGDGNADSCAAQDNALCWGMRLG